MLVGKPAALVFTGGIGEFSCEIRKLVLEGLAALDIKVDVTANDACFGKAGVISTADSAWKAVVMPTDEELMIAQHTQKIVC